jgi:protein-S-isoprenylcysteine O-methyltransferase Ste14
MRRRWVAYRRAYTPSIWPIWLVSVIVVVGVVYLARINSPWIIAGIGVLVGFAFQYCRWMIWRSRHPVISDEELLDDMRKAAPYN